MILPASLALGIVVILASMGILISPQIPESTPQPTPGPSAKLSGLSQLFNLKNWKLTLPVGSSGKPTEIKQPALNTYRLEPWFIPGIDALRFRASVTGVTTGGSKYPRSELREMTADGTANASWSSSLGTHTLFLDEAITAVPKTKQHVVAGQIHDADDDVIVIRLEYPNLYVNSDGKNVYTLEQDYTLGKRFTVRFVVKAGKTEVYYNSSTQPVYILSKDYSGAYFKAGAYTQSNCAKEDPALCNTDNFGEVVIYKADITHDN